MDGRYLIITGGLGYIGANLSRYLLKLGYPIVIIDKLSGGEADSTIKSITKDITTSYLYYNFDLTGDISKLYASLSSLEYSAIIHLAANKSIEESLSNQAGYLYNNVISTANVCILAELLRIPHLLFSSTAAVYDPKHWYCVEEEGYLLDDVTGSSTSNSNPYANSKLIGEELIKDYSELGKFTSTIFRFFNPIGSFEKAKVDNSDSIFGNIFNALSRNETFHIFGGDYPTPDGTCLRDYIDMRDLIEAIYLSLINGVVSDNKFEIFNLGTKRATSVLECCKVTKSLFNTFNWDVIGRRDGDSAAGIAISDKIKSKLGWSPKYSLIETLKYNFYDYVGNFIEKAT